MTVIKSFWFWLFIIGLLLILIAALIGGGMQKTTGWIWGLFIVGLVLAILGVIFAIVAWSMNRKNCMKDECPTKQYKSLALNESPSQCETSSPYKTSKYITPPHSPQHISYNSPLRSSCPLGTPTRVNTNIPQAQRGFATTSLNLSALSPN